MKTGRSTAVSFEGVEHYYSYLLFVFPYRLSALDLDRLAQTAHMPNATQQLDIEKADNTVLRLWRQPFDCIS